MNHRLLCALRSVRLPLRRSLLARFAVLVSATAVVALAAILGSLVTAEAMRGNAAAINLAGSLRMLSYRMVAEVLSGESAVSVTVSEFGRRLESPLLMERLASDPDDAVVRQYRAIEDRWRASIQPRIEQGGAGPDLLPQVVAFQQELDTLVKLLEQGTEDRVWWLRTGQIGLLLAMLVLLGTILNTAARRVVRPMSGVLAMADALRDRRFDARAPHCVDDELGLLAQAMNAAAADLDGVYRELEARVAQQTRALTESNRSLALLYGTIRILHERPVTAGTLEEVLRLLAREPGCTGVRLELAAPREETIVLQAGDPDGPSTISTELSVDGCTYGWLRAQEAGESAGPGARSALLDAVARHLAVALAADRRRRGERRVMLMEERQAIARDLHDSMAQALSYLMIQATLLDRRLKAVGLDDADAQDAVGAIHTALEAAYRQLRQLLDTFRLQPSDEALVTMLQRTMAEFRARGAPPVELEVSPAAVPLTPNQELHVLQIVREALSNVAQHARARRARVSLAMAGDDTVVVEIEDDGVGLPAQPERRHHYGMAILRERAALLGGRLTLEGAPGGGTRVSVRFRPGERARER